MKIYACNKCGSIDLFTKEKGSQTALMCGDCGSWIKWISKKELPIVERFIESNKCDNEPINTVSFKDNDAALYEILKNFMKQNNISKERLLEIVEILYEKKEVN